jgi:thiamine kinase-like enzyme
VAADVAVLLDQIPALADPEREVTELSGGLTNRNYKVVTSGGAYVARCFDQETGLLGIDREAEYRNSVAAHQAGVGAAVVDFRPDLGVLVIGFIEGRAYVNDDLQQPGVLPRVAEAVRRLHRGPRFVRDFDMFALQPVYLSTVEQGGYRMPKAYLELADCFADAARALAVQRPPTVPCNNDLLAGNLLDDGERIWLIDYEYSGNNDPYFELGNHAAECALTSEQLEELVTSYDGRSLRNRVARATVQGIVARYGWTLWGCIQAATSPIEFDFWEWAMEKYDAADAAMRGPEWGRLLLDVTRAD